MRLRKGRGRALRRGAVDVLRGVLGIRSSVPEERVISIAAATILVYREREDVRQNGPVGFKA